MQRECKLRLGGCGASDPLRHCSCYSPTAYSYARLHVFFLEIPELGLLIKFLRQLLCTITSLNSPCSTVRWVQLLSPLFGWRNDIEKKPTKGWLALCHRICSVPRKQEREGWNPATAHTLLWRTRNVYISKEFLEVWFWIQWPK